MGDEKMPKIIWKGIIKSEKDFPTADIPKNAKKLDSEENMKKMQIKALPFMIPSILLCFICMFVKHNNSMNFTSDLIMVLHIFGRDLKCVVMK